MLSEFSIVEDEITSYINIDICEGQIILKNEKALRSEILNIVKIVNSKV